MKKTLLAPFYLERDMNAMLRDQIKRSGRTRQAKKVFTSFPSARQLCLKATRHVLNITPHPREESLLVAMLKSGFDGWDQGGADLRGNYYNFIRGFFDPLPLLLRYAVFSLRKDGTEDVWDPCTASLEEWLANRTHPIMVESRNIPFDPPFTTPDAQLRTILGGRFLTYMDIKMLGENSHEVFKGMGNENHAVVHQLIPQEGTK